MTDSNNLLRNIYKLPEPSDYICSPYADYNPVTKTITKKKAAPDTVVVGGVTYHRQKKKKTKASPTTVVSLRLSNELIKQLDALAINGLSRADVMKDALYHHVHY